jgi:UV DNA damage endonuclease
MKIGYVGDSTLKGYHSAKRFRLASYTPELLLQTARHNIAGLEENITYSASERLLFYRIRSELIPFASHPICKEDWQKELASEFQRVGETISKHDMRISMHPDQFVVLNSPSEKVVQNGIAELQYHANLFAALNLDSTHKFQIHVGGVYDDKNASMRRFSSTYKKLPESITKHLVIENDDRLFSVNDCYSIHEETGSPILFDNFHFSLKNDGEDIRQAMEKAFSTWKSTDGIPMVDYSSQQEGWRTGRHADSIDIQQFQTFIEVSKGLDFDIMLEIKDKDKSALRAVTIIQT